MGADNNISPKEMAFCVEYATGGNGTKSAIEAGYPEASAAMTASRLIKKDHIRAKIAELQGVANDELVAGSTVTTANLINELNDAIIECRAAKQFGPMVRCIELKGKTIAAFTDSIENRLPQQTPEQMIESYHGGPLAKILGLHLMSGNPADDATVVMLIESYYSDNPAEHEKLRAEMAERKREQHEDEVRRKRAALKVVG